MGIVYIGLSAGAFVELKSAEIIRIMKNKLELCQSGLYRMERAVVSKQASRSSEIHPPPATCSLDPQRLCLSIAAVAQAIPGAEYVSNDTLCGYVSNSQLSH